MISNRPIRARTPCSHTSSISLLLVRGLPHSPTAMSRDAQGGKAFGILKSQQEEKLEAINKEFLDSPKYADEEDLEDKLETFKQKYMEFDLNDQGEIDLMGLKRMLEKLGVAKTHLELKKILTEVTGGVSETIDYKDFLVMMLGKKSAILRLILMFEDKSKEQEVKPSGPPPRKTFSDLP